MAKTNPYPISLVDYDDLVVSTLNQVASNTVESMAETMSERMSFTEKEIAWMKTTPIADVEMGENYTDEQDSSMVYFNLTGPDKQLGLKLSARSSTHKELRGALLRSLIDNAQRSGSQQSVYDAVQEHIRTLEGNTRSSSFL